MSCYHEEEGIWSAQSNQNDVARPDCYPHVVTAVRKAAFRTTSVVLSWNAQHASSRAFFKWHSLINRPSLHSRRFMRVGGPRLRQPPFPQPPELSNSITPMRVKLKLIQAYITSLE